MRRALWLSLAIAASCAHAAMPPVLLEACSAIEPAQKRLECLRAANARNAAAPQPGTVLQPAPAVPYVRRASPPLCYIERGGASYAITPDGRKNYGGC